MKDVTQDPEALRELVEDHQSRATPTIVVDATVVIGFDPEQLERLLGLS